MLLLFVRPCLHRRYRGAWRKLAVHYQSQFVILYPIGRYIFLFFFFYLKVLRLPLLAAAIGWAACVSHHLPYRHSSLVTGWRLQRSRRGRNWYPVLLNIPLPLSPTPAPSFPEAIQDMPWGTCILLLLLVRKSPLELNYVLHKLLLGNLISSDVRKWTRKKQGGE